MALMMKSGFRAGLTLTVYRLGRTIDPDFFMRLDADKDPDQ